MRQPQQDDDLVDDADADAEEHDRLLPSQPAARRDFESQDPSAWTNLCQIVEIAVPTALGNLSEFLPITFAMSMVGQLNGYVCVISQHQRDLVQQSPRAGRDHPARMFCAKTTWALACGMRKSEVSLTSCALHLMAGAERAWS